MLAAILSTTLIRDYLLNYARSLIYTTSLSYASVIAVDCAFDLLEDGTTTLVSLFGFYIRLYSTHVLLQLSNRVLKLSQDLVSLLRLRLKSAAIPESLIYLPPNLLTSSEVSPIIPLHTPIPISLSQYLRTMGMMALPIRYPTVPKGMERVRICIHARNTREEVAMLVNGTLAWATAQTKATSSKGTLTGANRAWIATAKL